MPKLFYNPFQPVAKRVVVFQRESTVKKRPIGVLFETRSILPLPLLLPLDFYLPIPYFSSQFRDVGTPTVEEGERIRGGEEEYLFRRARIFEQVPPPLHIREQHGTFDLRGHRGIP